jgi:hypothetical protein
VKTVVVVVVVVAVVAEAEVATEVEATVTDRADQAVPVLFPTGLDPSQYARCSKAG